MTIDEMREKGIPMDLKTTAAILDSMQFAIEETLRQGAEDEKAAGGELSPEDNWYNVGMVTGFLVAGDLAEALLLDNKNWKEDAEALEIVRDYENLVDRLTAENMPWHEQKNARRNAAEALHGNPAPGEVLKEGE